MLPPSRKYDDMDMISKLPLGIIETILCFLPIQEAARTSILSREWRYRWITIPKLAFIEETFQVTYDDELSILDQIIGGSNERKVKAKRCKIFNAVYQVLLMHEGPIHEFTLSMWADNSCVEIDHMLYHLSRKNTLKKLTLDICCGYKLPLSLFSLSHLTDLSISSCALDHQPTFKGFDSLTYLFLQEIHTTEKTLMHLLSNCPSLKHLNLGSNCTTIEYSDDYVIADLFKCLPVIEDLCISFHIILCFQPDRIPKKLPTALVHLKYLCMEGLSFLHKYGLPFLVLLIKSSPNLKKLKLQKWRCYMWLIDDSYLDEVEVGSVTLKDYQNIWVEHLNELEIVEFSDGKNALDFVRLILAKSPVLKKVRIYLDEDGDKDEELQILRVLLRSPCASPVVDIIVRQVRTS
ncbi:F-box/FBD/LRR-repeat protein At1g13570-like [Rutidosis leptorrhynchoides]|uniref:F-box/FBD/LRR-repeat protein At1g13570-like n=1 Tax=Rutidosis leptorrhynchoides TaxID=125765 RepID=UPI003A9A0BDC